MGNSETSQYGVLLQKLYETPVCLGAGSFLTEIEAEIIQDIIVSMSQDTEFVVKLRHAAQVMSEERTKRQQEEEPKQEREKAEDKVRAEKEREAEMKKKGKEKVQEGVDRLGLQEAQVSAIPSIREVTAQDHQEVMSELKQALDKARESTEAARGNKPLEGILKSFVAYYKNLKAKAQQVEDMRLK